MKKKLRIYSKFAAVVVLIGVAFTTIPTDTHIIWKMLFCALSALVTFVVTFVVLETACRKGVVIFGESVRDMVEADDLSFNDVKEAIINRDKSTKDESGLTIQYVGIAGKDM